MPDWTGRDVELQKLYDRVFLFHRDSVAGRRTFLVTQTAPGIEEPAPEKSDQVRAFNVHIGGDFYVVEVDPVP